MRRGGKGKWRSEREAQMLTEDRRPGQEKELSSNSKTALVKFGKRRLWARKKVGGGGNRVGFAARQKAGGPRGPATGRKDSNSGKEGAEEKKRGDVRIRPVTGKKWKTEKGKRPQRRPRDLKSPLEKDPNLKVAVRVGKNQTRCRRKRKGKGKTGREGLKYINKEVKTPPENIPTGEGFDQRGFTGGGDEHESERG